MSVPSPDLPRVFVGGVPFAASPADLIDWFANHGLEQSTITDVEMPVHQQTQRKKGFAIVTLADEATVTQAIALDHADMNGRYLNIRPFRTTPPARPTPPARQAKSRRERAAAAAGSADVVESAAPASSRPARAPRAPFVAPPGWKVIFVGNLAWSTTEEELASALAPGAECTVRLGWDSIRNRAKGFAHVEMVDPEVAAAAVAMDGIELGGRKLRINYAPARTEIQTE